MSERWIDDYTNPRDAFECLHFQGEWIAPYLENHGFEERKEGKYRKRSLSPWNDFMVYHVQYKQVGHVLNLEHEFDRMQGIPEKAHFVCNILFLECSVLTGRDFEKLWEVSQYASLFDTTQDEVSTAVIALIERSTERVYYYRPFKLPGSVYWHGCRLIRKIAQQSTSDHMEK